MGLFTSNKPKRMQLYHHDNGDLEFIRRDIVGESITVFDDTGDPKSSWIDYYQTLYPFNGYKNIPADAIQLAYGRHFHLEIHDILDDELRPPDMDSMVNNAFISAVAEARGIALTKSAKPRNVYEKLTLILSVALGMEMVIWGAAYALG